MYVHFVIASVNRQVSVPIPCKSPRVDWLIKQTLPSDLLVRKCQNDFKTIKNTDNLRRLLQHKSAFSSSAIRQSGRECWHECVNRLAKTASELNLAKLIHNSKYKYGGTIPLLPFGHMVGWLYRSLRPYIAWIWHWERVSRPCCFGLICLISTRSATALGTGAKLYSMHIELTVYRVA